MLDTAEITQMRSDIGDTLSHTCDISRNSATGGMDADRQPITVPETLVEDYPCYLWFPSEREQMGPDVEVVRGVPMLKLPWNADIEHGDFVTEVRDEYGVVLYSGILGVVAIQTRPTHKTVTLEKSE